MSQRTLSLQFQALDGSEETLVGQFPPCALSLLLEPWEHHIVHLTLNIPFSKASILIPLLLIVLPQGEQV